MVNGITILSQIFGYTLLLLWCMGPSVLIGVGALLATIPINIKVFEKYK